MTKQQRSFTTFLTMIFGFILAASILYYLLIPKNYPLQKLEAFEDVSNEKYRSSRQVTINSETPEEKELADKTYTGNYLDISDGELLFSKRCYQFPNSDIIQFKCYTEGGVTNDNVCKTNFPNYQGLYKNIVLKSFTSLTNSFPELESRIVCEIRNVYDKVINSKSNVRNCTISNTKDIDSFSSNGMKGPIYVVVTQAPYYYDKGTELAGNFNTAQTTDYDYCLRNIDNKSCEQQIFYLVQVIFSRYQYADKENNKIELANNDLMANIITEWDKTNYSKLPFCWVKTKGKVKNETFGGAATLKSYNGFNANYTITVNGPRNPKDASNDDQQTPSVFIHLYKINENHSLIKCMLQYDKNVCNKQ